MHVVAYVLAGLIQKYLHQKVGDGASYYCSRLLSLFFRQGCT